MVSQMSCGGLHSVPPYTPEGKAASSRNGLTPDSPATNTSSLQARIPKPSSASSRICTTTSDPSATTKNWPSNASAPAEWRLDRAFALETGIYREECLILTRIDRQGRELHELRLSKARTTFTQGGKGPDNFTRLVRYETARNTPQWRNFPHSAPTRHSPGASNDKQ